MGEAVSSARRCSTAARARRDSGARSAPSAHSVMGRWRYAVPNPTADPTRAPVKTSVRLPETRRRDLHLKIARALEGRAAWPPPELLADHFTKAERFERAVFYWQTAGDIALIRSANLEASRHYERMRALWERSR